MIYQLQEKKKGIITPLSGTPKEHLCETNRLPVVPLFIVGISKYVFVGCQEAADVKQVSVEGMQVCLETPDRLSLCVSPGAIRRPGLLKDWKLSALASDNERRQYCFHCQNTADASNQIR